MTFTTIWARIPGDVISAGTEVADDRRPIIVVGGRIAGSLVAALLAQRGERVVVLERMRTGAPVVSIALVCPDTLAVMDQIGFGQHLDSLGLEKIKHVSFEIAPGVRVSGPFPKSFGRAWGYAIRREILDRLLHEYVVSSFSGVDWIEGFRVEGLIREGERVIGVEGESTVEKRCIMGDFVIGADGKFSTIASLAEAKVLEKSDIQTCFYFAYFRHAHEALPGSLTTYHREKPFPFVAFSQTADAGLVGVGVQGSKARFARFRSDPAGVLRQLVSTIPELKNAIEGAHIEGKTQGMLVPPMYRKQCFGPGWALVGDASVHMNPITGQGVSFAARAARWLSEAIENWRGGAPELAAMNRYGEQVEQEFAADFARAAVAAELDAPIEPWRVQCYDWLSKKADHADAWLAMMTNAISIDSFRQMTGIEDAERSFGAR